MPSHCTAYRDYFRKYSKSIGLPYGEEVYVGGVGSELQNIVKMHLNVQPEDKRIYCSEVGSSVILSVQY